MVSLENVFVDDRCFLLALRDKGLNWPIVTRAHAPRHTIASALASPTPAGTERSTVRSASQIEKLRG
jgi:hypothetical protein